jgi:ribosomal-protein-serine acetyltransferase
MKIIIPIKDNLELKTLGLSDAREFFNLTKSNDKHLRQWLGWLDDDKTVSDTEKYIESSNKRFEEGEGLDLGIFYEDKLIGGIGLFPIDEANKKTSIAYWLSEEYQGKGIMSDSLKSVINYCFNELKLNRIEITVAVENTKSSSLPKKLGFTLEGIAREGSFLYDHFVDLEVYSLLASEWNNQI